MSIGRDMAHNELLKRIDNNAKILLGGVSLTDYQEMIENDELYSSEIVSDIMTLLLTIDDLQQRVIELEKEKKEKEEK